MDQGLCRAVAVMPTHRRVWEPHKRGMSLAPSVLENLDSLHHKNKAKLRCQIMAVHEK